MAKLLSWALYVRFAGMFAQLRSLAQWSEGLPNERQSAGMLCNRHSTNILTNHRASQFETVFEFFEYLSHAILTNHDFGQVMAKLLADMFAQLQSLPQWSGRFPKQTLLEHKLEPFVLLFRGWQPNFQR